MTEHSADKEMGNDIGTILLIILIKTLIDFAPINML
jgi:hypothetical protein